MQCSGDKFAAHFMQIFLYILGVPTNVIGKKRYTVYKSLRTPTLGHMISWLLLIIFKFPFQPDFDGIELIVLV